jgi:hypothetical protein
VLRPTALPWRRPRHELLLLALVAFAALSSTYVNSTQDLSHFCLSRAIVAGELKIDECAGNTVDRSVYGGHYYSNKAPGLSLLAIPAVEVVGLPDGPKWNPEADLHLWGVRLLTNGIAFLLCVFLVGRIAEGVAPGTGAPALVAVGLGTLISAFAATGFDHDVTAAFGFGAFVLAWLRRPALAGLAAGTAYLVEYQAAAIILLVVAYVALRGRGPLVRYVAGVVPGLVVSAAYSWAAFGRPWHNPHSYELNRFAGVNPHSGVLGVHFPSAHGIYLVFVKDRGLLVSSPVLVAAAAGLWLLWRRGFRAEALVAALVAAAFVVGDCGYGDPYGGLSAGPRYLIPGLPFLALGLGPAFARWRVPTAVLTAFSIVAGTTLMLTWASSADTHYRETVWGELARFLTKGTDSRLYGELTKNVLVWAGPNRLVAAAVVCTCAAAAYAMSLRARAPARPSPATPVARRQQS